MKVRGKPLVVKNKAIIIIVRKGISKEGEPETQEIILAVSPVPMGWHHTMLARGVMESKSPPMIAVKDPINDGYLRDSDGNIETTENWDDPRYKLVTTKMHRRIRALQFREHLKDDPEVEFDAVEPSDEEFTKKDKLANAWKVYADELLAEIKECGFTDEEVSAVTNLGESLSCHSNLQAGTADFLAIQDQEDVKMETEEGSSSMLLDSEESPTNSTLSGEPVNDGESSRKKDST